MKPEQAHALVAETFPKAFDKVRFHQFAKELLNGFDETKAAPMAVPDAFAPHVRSCSRLGTYESPDGELADVLIVNTTEPWKLERTRTALRDFVAHKLKRQDSYKEAGLVAFVAPDARSWRFSFVRMEYESKRDPKTGKIAVEERLTPARRFSYIVGENESCHTAQTRFLDLLQDTENKPTLAQIESAFSVEAVTKQFFADFSRIFEKVSADISKRNQSWTSEQTEREAQTLLSRLLFLYFIQRKGWLNRQRDYLYSKCREHFTKDPDGVSCYSQFLKPLFIKLSDADAFFPNLDLGDVPFLNGGLFDDEMDSLSERGRMKISNAVLRDVFEKLLELYNFTVREDTPLEQEVAIDPEMLGKIFESLVLQLEQSDAGGKTSRHDTGSYYTPRPIVHYLCREGLRAWLEQFPCGNASDWPSRLETLFSLDAAEDLSEKQRAVLDTCLAAEEARALLNRLEGFRACDPAVGSGAFLVGLLHELVSLHRLCETRARGKDPAERDSDWLYITKKRIIENVLYGVDIQQRAVEICNLRLWISLMVDYPLEVDPDNCALPDFRKAIRNITPLPNLDFKIRRANSLIEQIRGHTIKFPQTATDSRDFSLSLSKLATAKHRFYEAQKKKDKRLTQLDILDATAELAQYEFSAAKLKYGLLPSDKDADRVAELAQAEAEMGKLQMQIAAARKKGERDKDDDIERLSRVFNDESKPTFVWQLDFAEIFHRSVSTPSPRGEGGRDTDLDLNCTPNAFGAQPSTLNSPSGFDLVVGNPPYVTYHGRRRVIISQAELKYFKDNYICAFEKQKDGKYNSAMFFIEKFVTICGPNGLSCCITDISFYEHFYQGLKKYLLENTKVLNVVNGLSSFENVASGQVIIIASKVRSASDALDNTVRINNHGIQSETILLKQTEWYRAESKYQFFIPEHGLEGLYRKFEDQCRPLEHYFPSKLIRTGESIGVKEGGFVTDRPAHNSKVPIYEYLEGGKSVPVRYSAPKPTRYFRFDIALLNERNEAYRQDAINNNRKNPKVLGIGDRLAFDNPKILIRQSCDHLCCTYTSKPFSYNRSYYSVSNINSSGKSDVNLHYILALLNSTLFTFYARKKRIIRMEHGKQPQIRLEDIKTLRVKIATSKDQKPLIERAEQILAAKQRDAEAKTLALEREIDELVYALYGLTPEEIKIVEGAK